MRRIVVVGQPAPHGSLCFREFGRMLALRLGAHQVSIESPADILADDAWVSTERAGVFSESLFRHADTVIWLHFSPLAFVKDWLARGADFFRGKSVPRDSAPRSTWSDVIAAYGHLMIAPQLYQLFRHPALAHAKIVELRTPQQADYWLMAQRRRSGLTVARPGAESPPQAAR